MKISSISIYQLTLPLTKPYRLSGGRLLFEELDSTIVRIDTDAGISGWGEGCPWGASYLPGHGRGVRAAIAEFAPSLLGQDPRRTDRIDRQMDLALPGHGYAKSPVDIACWDILGKATGLPICELLGGREEGGTAIASSVSTAGPEEMLAEINSYRARGYHAHSAKVGADVVLDIQRVRLLAGDIRPGELIFFDVNRAWLAHEAIQVMNATGDLPIFFEQPCETLDEIAMVRTHTRQPISIDEGLKNFSDLLRIQHQGLGEIANIKLGRVGGLSKARRMRDFCAATGMAMLIMDTGGTVLADTAVQHLAQTLPAHLRLGTWLCQELLTIDTAPQAGSRNIGGKAFAPQAPGLGVAPDPAVLGEAVAIYT